MLRRNQLIVTAALVAVCAVPGTAAAQQDLRNPDTRDAAAASAARDLPSAQMPAHANPGPYTDAERAIVESPEVQQASQDIIREIRPIVEVHEPSGGFDWGDAGIGAAGMLGLFSIAAGSALLLTGRKRRQGVKVAH